MHFPEPLPGVVVYLAASDNPARKTKWKLKAALLAQQVDLSSKIHYDWMKRRLIGRKKKEWLQGQDYE